MKRVRRGGGAVAATLLLFGVLSVGCATTLDVRVPAATNPTAGPAVTFVRVTDRREFQRKPPEASIPSLKDGQIEDRALTSRAIGRKRSGWGKALGDILLPEGRSVEQLTAEALARGLRESGYRVIEPASPGREDAIPLEVDIQEFWAWVAPGWNMHISFDSRIRVTGPAAPFRKGQEFTGHIRLGTSAPTGGAWLNTINKGLEYLNQDMTTRLAGAAAGVDASQ
jgi:hypothetical protein